MGLFDYIHVNQPGFDPDEAFQTKDFDPYMHRYDITNDGRLTLTQWIFGSGLGQPEEVDFHGIVHFHTLRDNDDWVECEAKFTDGRLMSIQKKVFPLEARNGVKIGVRNERRSL